MNDKRAVRAIAAFLKSYLHVIRRRIAINETIVARIAPCHACSQSVALTFDSFTCINFAGSAHSFKSSASNLADATSKSPLMIALPPHILLWIVGEVTNMPPTKIPICF